MYKAVLLMQYSLKNNRMKNYFTIKLLFTLVFFLSINIANAQKVATPTHVVWKVDGKQVSLKAAHSGIDSPEELTIEVFFSDEDVTKMKADGTEIEFKWYYYYATSREYMDSYTVSYNESETDAYEQKKMSSTRGDISKGWWEVHIVSVDSDEKMSFNKIKQFQIFVN